MKKKIYIAGCGGMLGDAFHSQFKEEYELKCTDKDVNSEWLSYLDFRNYNDYRKDVIEFNPDYLFHLGAYTDLEYCENNVEDTYITNTISVENAVLIANELDIPILYISTAGIFDGNKKVYDDWDIPNPLGVYARSKYMGERYVVENAKRYLVCRAGWMMGSGLKDKKFVKRIMNQVKIDSTRLYVVNDKYGSPTYTIDFADNVKILLEKEFWGLYNMTGSGSANRFEVAQEIINIINRNDIRVFPVSSISLNNEYFAERPEYEVLINKKLDLRGLNIMRDWKITLKEYLNSYYL